MSAPYEPLLRGYCTLCCMMKFHVKQNACPPCRDISLAEAQEKHKRAQDTLEKVKQFAQPDPTIIRTLKSEVAYAQRLIDFHLMQDACEERVRYVASSTKYVPAMCAALAAAGAREILSDSQGIDVVWYSKTAKKSYEEQQ